MNAKHWLPCVAVAMSLCLTGCDDDDVEYFGSTDPFFFVFSFGDTVSMKPTNANGASAPQATGPTQSTNAQPAEASVPASPTGSVQRVLYSSDLPSYPIFFGSAKPTLGATSESQTAPAASSPLPFGP